MQFNFPIIRVGINDVELTKEKKKTREKKNRKGKINEDLKIGNGDKRCDIVFITSDLCTSGNLHMAIW